MKQRRINQKQLPISEYQKRFFLEWALAPQDSIYNVSLVNKLRGKLNKNILKQACEIFIKRNEAVHAQYSEDGESCYYGDFSIDDFYHESTFNSIQPIDFQIREILNKPFDLTKDVLLRLHLVKNKENESEFYFIILSHHIIGDGTSALEICLQIQNAYNLLVEGNIVSSNVDKTFTQAVEAEQKIINSDYKDKAQKYWLDFIGDLPLNISLPYCSNTDVINFDNRLADKTGEYIYFELSREQTIQLKTYAKQKGTTVFIVLSALYGLVLSKYCNQERLLLSYPINMRSKGFNEIIGCFVNNVPLKLELDKTDALDKLIEILGDQRKKVKQYQGYSLTDIMQDQRTFNHREIESFFNVGFAQTNLNATTINLKDIESLPVDIAWSVENINEIGLLFDEYSSNVIKFKFEYRKVLFDKDLIQSFIKAFKNGINELVNGKKISIKTFTVLSPEEYDKIVYQRNLTSKDFPENKTVHQIFQEQAERSPDNIALVYEGRKLTYQELNEKSNQLARHIREQYKQRTEKSFKADTLVALYLDRSLEMVIGMLAVLKAGGTYVPMDPSDPEKRVDIIIEDARAELILSQRHLNEDILSQLQQDKVIFIDLSEEIYSKEDESNLLPHSTATDLAYVIYTSGTTGRPKGVMIEHRAILSLVYNDYIKVSSNDVFAFLSSPVFDASTFEVWTPLMNGNPLIIPKDVKNIASDIKEFNIFLTFNRVSILWLTKTLFESLYYSDNSIFKSLNYLIIGGEALDKNTVKKLVNSLTKPKHFLNGYGPTESTTFTCTYDLSNQITSFNVPIGIPINNRITYVIDQYNNPVPIGVIGELYIGGAGLARGYLNKKDLTEERFIPNPFATEADKAKGYTWLYKTGDLVRWLQDGNMEFIGRNDDQIKIRGYRIELGEIEHALSKIRGIKQNCVLAKERKTELGSNKYLVGYYVLDSNYISENDPNILNSWEDIFDSEYKKNIEEIKTESDFTGWNSYITGEPFPISEMEEWRDNIVSLLKGFNPSNVLEIGVGSGLLMYPLLDHVQRYVGFDISLPVINRHKNYLKNKNYNVNLYQLRADQIDQLPKNEFYDTIIINVN